MYMYMYMHESSSDWLTADLHASGMIAYKHGFLVRIELDFHTLGRNERNNNHQSHGAGLSLYYVKMNERR